MDKNNDMVYYSGDFNKSEIDKILSQIKEKLNEQSVDPQVIRRIYSASVECLDNILKHTPKGCDEEEINLLNNYPSKFSLKRENDFFNLLAGNVISDECIEPLKTKFEVLASLKSANLMHLHKKKLLAAEISEKGGAGLGLIIISRLSGKKIKYDFEKINNKFSYFALQIEFSNILD